MNKHNITAANYQKEFVMVLAKSGEAILHSLVPDTGNPEFEWDQEFLKSAFEKLHILHMAIGVAGEGVEFFLVCRGFGDEDSTIIEELGDTLFYCAGLAEVFDLDFCGIVANSLPEGNEIRFLYNTSQVLEQTKKYFIYSDDSRKQKVEEALYKVASNILDVMACENITLEQVIDHNVEKLDERYAGLKYSDKAAQVRADKQEDVETAKCAKQYELVFAEDSVQEDNTGGNNPPEINN
jgi:NTP pyrophosphatase (non-canonical NTP hydrolase)